MLELVPKYLLFLACNDTSLFYELKDQLLNGYFFSFDAILEISECLLLENLKTP